MGLPGAAAVVVGLVGLLKPSRERVLVGVGEDGAEDGLKLGMMTSVFSGCCCCCGMVWVLPEMLPGSAWLASSSMAPQVGSVTQVSRSIRPGKLAGAAVTRSRGEVKFGVFSFSELTLHPRPSLSLALRVCLRVSFLLL